jgi:hypothetical protein
MDDGKGVRKRFLRKMNLSGRGWTGDVNQSIGSLTAAQMLHMR